jgi:hypothetical protein
LILFDYFVKLISCVNQKLTIPIHMVARLSAGSYGRSGDCGSLPQLRVTDRFMRRVIAIAAAGLSLAGCSSFSTDYFKSAPPTLQVQIESNPPGADARTSLGQSCKTPCSVALTVPETGGFTVSYTMARFQPATVPVQIIRVPGEFFSSGTVKSDPNPVVVELQPAGPPPRAHKMRPKKPKVPKGAAGAPAADDDAAPGAPPPPAATPAR